MGIEISLVPPVHVHEVWKEASPFLKRSTDLSGGRYRLRDLRAKLEAGEFQLWIIFEGDPKNMLAAITSTFSIYPQCRSLHGQFLGGDRLDEWREQFCSIFDRWGRDNGCRMIEFTGRKGWGKALESNGYREAFRIFQRDLSH